MTKPDFTVHRERLLALRGRLQGDMIQMADAALSKDHSDAISVPTDTAELGTGNSDQELTLSLMGSEKNALDQIDGALKRIEDGSYGVCEDCGEEIGLKRLEARPVTTLCIDCKTLQETREKSVGQ